MPFIKTSFLPPDGSGENIMHCTAIRLRVNGRGNLRARLLSLDEQITTTLVPLVMSQLTSIQPTRLANFEQQRMQLELKTTAKDEVFRINRIILFTKEVATSYPG